MDVIAYPLNLNHVSNGATGIYVYTDANPSFTKPHWNSNLGYSPYYSKSIQAET